MRDARKQTDWLLGLMQDGVISAEDIVYAALGYMSEAEVAHMIKLNQFNTLEVYEE